MPKVDGKEYPYSEEGQEAAAAARKRMRGESSDSARGLGHHDGMGVAEPMPMTLVGSAKTKPLKMEKYTPRKFEMPEMQTKPLKWETMTFPEPMKVKHRRAEQTPPWHQKGTPAHKKWLEYQKRQERMKAVTGKKLPKTKAEKAGDAEKKRLKGATDLAQGTAPKKKKADKKTGKKVLPRTPQPPT